MRQSLWLCLIATIAALAGCASLERAPATLHPNRFLAGSSFLLFNRLPGNTHAGAIPPRPAWPVALSGARVREHIFFVERFEDRQGHNLRSDNTFYRRFTTRREGIIER